MASRRGKGEGSMRWREDKQLWEGRYNVGVNPKTGKVKQKSIYGKKKKDVLRRMRDALQALDKGLYVDPSKMILYDWCVRWLTLYKLPTINRINTRKKYEMALKRLSRYDIAGVPIKDITSDMLQRTYNDMHTEYMASTITITHTLINSALIAAVRLRKLPQNPAAGTHIPRDTTPERVKALTEDQLEQFLRALKQSSSYYVPALFMVNTGVRPGENFGLSRGDFTIAKPQIKVHSTYLFKEKRLQPETKTQSSTRVVPVPTFLVPIMQRYMLQQPNKASTAPLFQSKLGDRIALCNFERQMKNTGAAIGCGWVTPHTLRHTYASRLFAQGVDVKVVSALLGHKSVTTTYDLYIHFIDDSTADAVQLLNHLAPEAPKKNNLKILGT